MINKEKSSLGPVITENPNSKHIDSSSQVANNNSKSAAPKDSIQITTPSVLNPVKNPSSVNAPNDYGGHKLPDTKLLDNSGSISDFSEDFIISDDGKEDDEFAKMIATKKIVDAKPVVIPVKSDIIASKVDKPAEVVSVQAEAKTLGPPTGPSITNTPSKLTPLSGDSSKMNKPAIKASGMTSLSNLPPLIGVNNPLTSLSNLPPLINPLHSKNFAEITKIQSELPKRKEAINDEDFGAGHTDSEDDKF